MNVKQGNMAWGLWNKIKKGFQKVGKAIKTGAKWINDKIVKPFKPVIKTVANAIVPGIGGTVVDVASDGIDAVTSDGVQGALTWATNKFRR